MNELFFLNLVWITFSKFIRCLEIGKTGKTGRQKLREQRDEVKRKNYSEEPIAKVPINPLPPGGGGSGWGGSLP
ncbi:MAG: hypothetical protein KJ649_00170 [Proteobacteria bacterium]|nr:hypothetical protein [Pseudomonadota bacterium]